MKTVKAVSMFILGLVATLAVGSLVNFLVSVAFVEEFLTIQRSGVWVIYFIFGLVGTLVAIFEYFDEIE
jgi:hypothetical protein